MSDFRESIARSPSDPPGHLVPEAPLDDVVVARRNGYARPLLETFARFDPERASAIAVPGAAERTSRLSPSWTEQRIAAWADAERTLGRQLRKERHPALRLDLEAMKTATRWELDVLRLEAALMLPISHPAQICFEGIRALVDEPEQGGASPALTTAIKRPASTKQRRRRWSPIRDATLKVLRNRPGQKLTVAQIRTAIRKDLNRRGSRQAVNVNCDILEEAGLVKRERAPKGTGARFVFYAV